MDEMSDTIPECWKCDVHNPERRDSTGEHLIRVYIFNSYRWLCEKHLMDGFLSSLNQFGKIKIEAQVDYPAGTFSNVINKSDR